MPSHAFFFLHSVAQCTDMAKARFIPIIFYMENKLYLFTNFNIFVKFIYNDIHNLLLLFFFYTFVNNYFDMNSIENVYLKELYRNHRSSYYWDDLKKLYLMMKQ